MKYIKIYENFYNIEINLQHLRDLFFEIQDDGEWTLLIINVEKWDADDPSGKILLTPNPTGLRNQLSRNLLNFIINCDKYMSNENYTTEVIIDYYEFDEDGWEGVDKTEWNRSSDLEIYLKDESIKINSIEIVFSETMDK